MAGVYTIEKIGEALVGEVVDDEIEDMEYPSFLLRFSIHTDEGDFSTEYDLGYVRKGISLSDLFPTDDGKKVIHVEIDDDKWVSNSIKVTRNDGKTTYTFTCVSSVSGTIYKVSVPVSSPGAPFIQELKKLSF
jgi:hypothetical protein